MISRSDFPRTVAAFKKLKEAVHRRRVLARLFKETDAAEYHLAEFQHHAKEALALHNEVGQWPRRKHDDEI